MGEETSEEDPLSRIRSFRGGNIERGSVPALAMTVWLLLQGAVSAQEPAQTADSAEAPTAAEGQVRDLVRAFTAAYNAEDAEAVSALFADRCTLLNGEGVVVRDREAVEAHYQEAFGEGPTAQVTGEVESIRLVTPDVASASGRFRLEDRDGAALAEGQFSLLAVARDGAWKIAELQDHPTATPDVSEGRARLRELEWMLGEWINEGEDVEVRTHVRWAADGPFLVREYRLRLAGAAAGGGTQWIGWDPQAGQIKSWVFDSNGGHGEGLWTEDDGRWIVKARGVLDDGRATSATQVFEPTDSGAIRFRSFDRIVGGELQPDLDEVILVRQPPAPATGTSPAAKAGEPTSDRP